MSGRPGPASHPAARVASVVVALLLGSATAGAQQVARDSIARRMGAALCPENGIAIGVEGVGAPDRTRREGIGTGPSTGIDTTIVFAVTSRTWRWTDVVAHVSAGASGRKGGVARAGERSGTDGAPWHLCAGAVAALREATLTLRGASGAIRLRIDPSGFSRFTIPFDSAALARP